MKKIFALVLALVLVAAFTVPAMAVTTDITVTTSGVAPIVKAKWESPNPVIAPEGNADDCANLEIGKAQVEFWAVVAHNSGPSVVTGVYADVFHPNVHKQGNLFTEADPKYDVELDETGAAVAWGEWCNSFKYQVELWPYMHADNAAEIAALKAAYEAGLVTFESGYDYADCVYQINQGVADVYKGIEYLENHQPAGNYDVYLSAFSSGAQSNVLQNTLVFAELNSFVLDFESVVYNNVPVNQLQFDPDIIYWTQVPGDASMCTPSAPTVWNNGNTYINLTVSQNDAGFGTRTLPDGTTAWNVHWGARIGSEGEGTLMKYEPGQTVTLPEGLIMCTPTKLDFFISVDKNPDGKTSFGGTMTIGSVINLFDECGTF